VQTENRAGLNVCTYAEGVPDSLLRKAIELNGFEERRHRHVLANLVEAYGIKLAPEPVYERPKDPNGPSWSPAIASASIPSSRFGLFKAAKDTGYFPPELIQTFDPVVNEEGPHILFFRELGGLASAATCSGGAALFRAQGSGVWLFLIYERMASHPTFPTGQQDNNFTLSGAEQLGSDIDVGELIAICVAENDRRLKPYDNRLKRPRLCRSSARLALNLSAQRRRGRVMKIGSPEHRDTFLPPLHADLYRNSIPENLPWPDLDEAALTTLKSVPFWEEVFYTERRAGAIVAEFVKTVKDPVMKEAVAMQGFEEARHAKLIRVMIDKYGIDAAERPLEDVSDNVETRFKDFGFGECMDSFLGFGVFKIAMQSEFLPKEMFDYLRNPDVRGNPPHRLLRQLDGLSGGAEGRLGARDAAHHQFPLLHARPGPHDRHRQARQGHE
jgi:hypothetical protein